MLPGDSAQVWATKKSLHFNEPVKTTTGCWRRYHEIYSRVSSFAFRVIDR
jgi:hypothetical protein